MGYQRFLDVHLGKNFNEATFKRDVAPQQQRQEGKVEAYKSIIVDELSVSRDITLTELSESIKWVCDANSEKGGKLRINSHGNERGVLSTGTQGSGISAEKFAAYLVKHGLTSAAIGAPGLTTINLACCFAASGPQKDWMIKRFADELKLPKVKVTGADAITRMKNGVMQVKYETYLPPASGAYVPPQRRQMTTVEEQFKTSTYKKTYIYGDS